MLRPYKENRTVLKNCLTIDLGLIGYAEAYALQERIVAARKAEVIEDVLLLCEHPHVITQGRSGKWEHLLATAEFGITAERVAGKTGIWVKSGDTEEKLGAIGVRISRWVTSHGLAYNVSTDLRYFDLIVPCGIANRKATSLEKLLGRSLDPNEVERRLEKHFGEVFGREMKKGAREELLEKLEHVELQAAVSA